MQCPVCQLDLQMTERQGIEIDYCPKCRGIWLDRGELDKLIERSTAQLGSGPQPVSDKSRARDHDSEERPRKHDSEQRPRKKEGFWSELFDFG